MFSSSGRLCVPPNTPCCDHRTETNFKSQRFSRWLTRKQPVEVWFEVLQDAKTYEDWEEAAFQLDVLLGNDLWCG